MEIQLVKHFKWPMLLLCSQLTLLSSQAILDLIMKHYGEQMLIFEKKQQSRR